MITRSLSYVLASFCTLVACVSVGHAGIVLTPIQTSLPTSNNVTVNLYARWDGNLTGGGIPNPAVNSANVGAYQFRISITGGTVSGLAAQHNMAPSSAWSNVEPYAVFPIGSPVISGQQIDWRAANTDAASPVPIVNATLGTSNNAGTLLGTIQFTAPIGNYLFNFSALTQQDYPSITGFGYIQTNGAGAQYQHSFVAPATTISVVAVPEPSTLLLCSLAGIAYPIRRRLRRK